MITENNVLKMTKHVYKRKRRTIFLIMILAFMAVESADVLFAQDEGSVYLTRGIRKYREEWDISGAIDDLQKALSFGLRSEQERIDAYQCLAFCFAENGEKTKSVEAFVQLLELNRDFGLSSDTSPRFMEPFDEAKEVIKEKYKDVEPPILTDLTEGPVVVGEPFTIRVKVQDNDKVAQVGILYRVGDKKEFEKQREMTQVQENVYEFVVAETRMPGVYYRIDAWDSSGNQGRLRDGNELFAEAVDLTAPSEISVKPAKNRKWIYYTAGAVAVASAGIYLLVKPKQKAKIVVDMPTSF
jgi:hypothetical protein